MAGVYLSEAPIDPPPPTRYTLYEYLPLYLFTYLFTQGREEGGQVNQ
jgi:hypothetical protein